MQVSPGMPPPPSPPAPHKRMKKRERGGSYVNRKRRIALPSFASGAIARRQPDNISQTPVEHNNPSENRGGIHTRPISKSTRPVKIIIAQRYFKSGISELLT